MTDAVDAVRHGRTLGGNQMYVVAKADTDTRVQAYDKIWVKHIKSALMENRFRLVQQPIASLLGEDKGMFDVLVRMLDEQGAEVLPAEFMAAAERNELMKNIDRWVIGASMSFSANRKLRCIFLRISKDTVLDKTLIPWLETQLRAIRVDPKRLCFQVSEDLATQYVRQTKELAQALGKLGFRFALEHFGVGRDPLKLLAEIDMHFIKVDGSLMQGLSRPINCSNSASRASSRPPSTGTSRRSPSASRTPTRWPSSGSSASSSSRGISSMPRRT